MIDPFSWIDDEARDRAGRGLSRQVIAHGRVQPGRFERGGRWVVNFGANDYLGLAADPRVVDTARRAAERFGWGAGASPLVSGWTDEHEALADSLAAFERAETVVLFPTGYAANLGTIGALVGKGDAVYSDRLNHACLIDGARLSGASVRVYPHADADSLAVTLERDRGRFRRTLIATDGVFSMDGDLAPLERLADLAESFGAMLLVDEAHGTGVFGPDGRGAASARGVAERVAVRVGTLSKALGSLGGFVAGSQRLAGHLVNRARTQIYSTALPPAAAAAAREALAIAQAEPWRRERVFALAARLREALGAAGHTLGLSEGPILPVMVGDPGRAVTLSKTLEARGLYVPAIRPPTVPEGTSRLRVSLSAAHTDDDLDALIAGLAEATPGG
jgi:8-amino-7-oxononanoate synthase